MPDNCLSVPFVFVYAQFSLISAKFQIRRLRSAKGDEEAETEIRDNYENYEI